MATFQSPHPSGKMAADWFEEAECSFRKKNGTNWSPRKTRTFVANKTAELMKSGPRRKRGGNRGSCSIWNSRARRRVCTVRCRLAKDSWYSPEIKGSHSFFRGNANEKLEHGDYAYQSKSCEARSVDSARILQLSDRGTLGTWESIWNGR